MALAKASDKDCWSRTIRNRPLVDRANKILVRLYLKDYCSLCYVTLVGSQISLDMAGRIVPCEQEHQVRNGLRPNSIFDLERKDFFPQIVIDRVQQALCELGQ